MHCTEIRRLQHASYASQLLNTHMLACQVACNLCLPREPMLPDTRMCDLCRTSMM